MNDSCPFLPHLFCKAPRRMRVFYWAGFVGLFCFTSLYMIFLNFFLFRDCGFLTIRLPRHVVCSFAFLSSWMGFPARVGGSWEGVRFGNGGGISRVRGSVSAGSAHVAVVYLVPRRFLVLVYDLFGGTCIFTSPRRMGQKIGGEEAPPSINELVRAPNTMCFCSL